MEAALDSQVGCQDWAGRPTKCLEEVERDQALDCSSGGGRGSLAVAEVMKFGFCVPARERDANQSNCQLHKQNGQVSTRQTSKCVYLIRYATCPYSACHVGLYRYDLISIWLHPALPSIYLTATRLWAFLALDCLYLITSCL
jgi:hypothetical protein